MSSFPRDSAFGLLSAPVVTAPGGGAGGGGGGHPPVDQGKLLAFCSQEMQLCCQHLQAAVAQFK